MTKLIRVPISWFLLCGMVASALAQPLPKDRLAEFNAGDRITVRTINGSVVEGTLDSKTAQELAINTGPKGVVLLSLADVRSVARTHVRKTGGKTKWIVIGAVAGAAIIAGTIFARRLNNEGAL